MFQEIKIKNCLNPVFSILARREVREVGTEVSMGTFLNSKRDVDGSGEDEVGTFLTKETEESECGYSQKKYG